MFDTHCNRQISLPIENSHVEYQCDLEYRAFSIEFRLSSTSVAMCYRVLDCLAESVVKRKCDQSVGNGRRVMKKTHSRRATRSTLRERSLPDSKIGDRRVGCFELWVLVDDV